MNTSISDSSDVRLSTDCLDVELPRDNIDNGVSKDMDNEQLKDSTDIGEESTDVEESKPITDIEKSEECMDVGQSKDTTDTEQSKDITDLGIEQSKESNDGGQSKDNIGLEQSKDSTDIRQSKESNDGGQSKESMDIELPQVTVGPPIAPAIPSMEDIVPQLQNVVSTVNLGCKLNLAKIACYARNAEYNPNRFGAVVMRIRDPCTTALIFKSGKIICTGARSEEKSNLAARKFARIIQKIGFKIKFINFQIHNMVATCDVRFPIGLERLCSEHYQFCSYEPEIFPGLVYRLVSPKVVILIFVTGKIVLTGAKNREDLAEAFRNIYPVLKCFMKSKFN